MAFTVGNSVVKCLDNAWENYRKTLRKTINEHYDFVAFTTGNSVAKHLENAAFAHSDKLKKNMQENKLSIGIFMVLDNTR